MNDATKDAPAFDFYPERWTHGTRMLTKVERCDYLDLLCSQWTDDGLPADPDILARIIGYRKGSQIPAMVMEKFPVSADGKRRNARLEIERARQRERIAKRRDGAHKTNAKRWPKRVDDGSLSDAESGRLATPERHQSDIASESPPPTTHPLINKSTACAPPTEAQVLAYASNGTMLITPDCALRWLTDREMADWTYPKGLHMLDVLPNWQSNLRGYAMDWNKRSDEQKSRQKQPKNTPTPAPYVSRAF